METQSNPPTSHVEINGSKFALRESGQGEPLVLLHAHLADMRSWNKIEPKLATRFHVYNYSRRWFWPNEPIGDDEPESWDQHAMDLIALIEQLNVGPVHVMGNSSGATVILIAAKTRQDLFKSMTIIEPAVPTLWLPCMPKQPGLTDFLSMMIKHPVVSYEFITQAAPYQMKTIESAKKGEIESTTEIFGAGVLGQKYWDRIMADPERKKQVFDNAKCLTNVYKLDCIGIFRPDDASNLTKPLLLMAGKEAPYICYCSCYEIHRLAPAKKKRLATIPNAGHLTHEDNPDVVFEELVKFVFNG